MNPVNVQERFKHTNHKTIKKNEETENICNDKNIVVQKIFMMMEKNYRKNFSNGNEESKIKYFKLIRK